jgi:hypothetical protein
VAWFQENAADKNNALLGVRLLQNGQITYIETHDKLADFMLPVPNTTNWVVTVDKDCRVYLWDVAKGVMISNLTKR